MQTETLESDRSAPDGVTLAVLSEPAGKSSQARGLMQAFVRTVKSYRIYAAKNPILRKFVEQFHQQLKDYIEEHRSFRLRVEELRFLCDGEVVYEDEILTESLPFLMHRNGLRELWFDDKVTYGELTDFFDTFRSYEILKDSNDDLVTLLWDKNFPSIHFWATDDFLWAPVDIPDSMKDILAKTEAPVGEEKADVPVGEQENGDSSTPLLNELVNFRELSEVKETLPSQIEDVDHANLLMILVEVVSHSGKDPKKFESFVSFFKTVLDRLLVSQDFNNLSQILSFTKILIRDRRLDSREMEFIREIVAYLNEPQTIDRLMISLARFKNFDHGQFQKYLMQLSKTAIEPLCRAWLKMESAEGRIAISNALVELGREDIPALGRFVDATEWVMVFYVIDVLSRIGEDQCIGYISRVRNHKNAKVRNQALHALSTFNHPSAKALLPAFLGDPEMQIRINALRLLVKKLGPEALPFLGPHILANGFHKREPKEKRGMIEGLGRIQTPDSVAILEQLLYRRVFLQRSKWRETKLWVESVLASMDLDEARLAHARWQRKRRGWFFSLIY